ncbi:Uncharacterised protein [Yersinia frederiksenii]|uniref:DUF4387 domain-containing protein n=2 Tax=Yersinia frederiksenii TaxID=29484 RepID=A0A380PS94_YERFR|nr:DUF4387 domain-containing protein [Yersinia frederiksenii]ATM94974.1 DUF4387 domain-containing protein [Yersinia frederiksenii]KGA47247.1 hypothetical protein DJ58_2098 [Yersinia frederiksenii ATCC 33641]SUP76475.1 Uncharacterised protein [Yersinia frederiksenii]
MKISIIELAHVVRSKNAGPYELVLDILFKNKDIYSSIKESGQFKKELIAKIYKIEPKLVSRIIWFDPANAVKIVMPRHLVSGAVSDTDVYGAQQHAPLLKLEFNI